MTPQLSQVRSIKDSGDRLISAGSARDLSSTPEDGNAGKEEREQTGDADI